MRYHAVVAVLLAIVAHGAWADGPSPPVRSPRLRAVDLDIGETVRVDLCDGTTAHVKLLALGEARDPIRSAVRRAQVKLEINGQPVELTSATYHLPKTVGRVQVDCPITRGYLSNTTQDHWGLVKAARLRLWPAGSRWLEPGTFVYPVRQRWFATATQMANEPTYVDGFERPSESRIYYHSGLDIGGAEGLVDVIAASAGLVVSAGRDTLAGDQNSPAKPRYDVVYVRDDQGWYYRYSHLQMIDSAVKPGVRVALGQKLGVLGKEGDSGGWSHLHFEIVSKQPSGRWGTQEGYAFLWESWLRDGHPAIVAVARPHHLTWTGERVTLDGSRSWSRNGIAGFDWRFSDGSTAGGPKAERTYDQPGEYSETLKVTDNRGNIAYDFAIVQVLDRKAPDVVPPSIHAAYSPTLGLHAHDRVTFKVRTFGTTEGHESWDFGDGSPIVQVQSDGNVKPHAPDGYATIVHRFAKPGDYLVRVERADRRGHRATARLWVRIDPDGS